MILPRSYFRQLLQRKGLRQEELVALDLEGLLLAISHLTLQGVLEGGI